MSQLSSPNIFPALRYRDAAAAIEWLCRAFGFEEKAVHRDEQGTVAHAELRLGTGMIMLGQFREGSRPAPAPDSLSQAQTIYVVVQDPDAHHARAKAAGADVGELVEQDYGSREYSATDLEGNWWAFGTYDPYATA